MMRAGFIRGKSGVQTVYDVFSVAPLGAGVLDPTPGSTMVTGYFMGQELKNLLEFLLIDSAAHPGEYFPRASGLRFRYDPSRPKLDVVTAIETGRPRPRLPGHRHQRETTPASSVSPARCMLARSSVAIPKYTKGKLALVAKNKDGHAAQVQSRSSRRCRAPTRPTCFPRRHDGCETVSPPRRARTPVTTEIKEWQAIMDHLRSLPAKNGELPVIPVDERANEVRAIKVG
jgi:5'-nucleotidase/UDP-sugar diphosphatase